MKYDLEPFHQIISQTWVFNKENYPKLEPGDRTRFVEQHLKYHLMKVVGYIGSLLEKYGHRIDEIDDEELENISLICTKSAILFVQFSDFVGLEKHVDLGDVVSNINKEAHLNQLADVCLIMICPKYEMQKTFAIYDMPSYKVKPMVYKELIARGFQAILSLGFDEKKLYENIVQLCNQPNT
jgi:hypothetical protein